MVRGAARIVDDGEFPAAFVLAPESNEHVHPDAVFHPDISGDRSQWLLLGYHIVAAQFASFVALGSIPLSGGVVVAGLLLTALLRTPFSTVLGGTALAAGWAVAAATGTTDGWWLHLGSIAIVGFEVVDRVERLERRYYASVVGVVGAYAVVRTATWAPVLAALLAIPTLAFLLRPCYSLPARTDGEL